MQIKAYLNKIRLKYQLECLQHHFVKFIDRPIWSNVYYCCRVHRADRKHNIKMIHTIHYQVLRFSLVSFRSSAVDSLYVQTSSHYTSTTIYDQTQCVSFKSCFRMCFQSLIWK